MSFGNTLFEGSWEEALRHPDAISPKAHIRIVEVEEFPEEEDELDGKTLADLFEGRIGVVSFAPDDLSERLEEYLANGFGSLSEHRTTKP